jgi:conjugal transfer pilus assembly protein TraW
MVLLIFSSLVFANAVKIYETGTTYEFAENDMLEDIKEHIKNNRPEIEKKFEEIKQGSKSKIQNFQPQGLISLPSATKNNIFYPDMSYTNPDNIYDNEGRLIYPKGFTFNPLDFQMMHTVLVVIDGTSKEQLLWLQKNGYANNIKYKILLSDGNYQEVAKKLKQHVFYCLPQITKKFQLKHTPSVITQIGNKMEVKEICIKCKESKKR